MIDAAKLSEKELKVLDLLQEVPDPEIPVISVVELGVVQGLKIQESGNVNIKITPTYSGCPAIKAFEDDITSHLNKHGFSDVSIELVYSPAWTTDWMSDAAREKLRKFGIAPPIDGTADKGQLFSGGTKNVPCPFCKSTNTFLESQFGSTACKALYKCNDCQEPFEYFKCI